VAFLGDDLLEELLERRPVLRLVRQKQLPDTVLTGRWQRYWSHLSQEAVRQLDEDACAVSRVDFAPTRPSVLQVLEHLERFLDDGV
jgi:hypothetical protein